jgi:hypothetical protein
MKKERIKNLRDTLTAANLVERDDERYCCEYYGLGFGMFTENK